jgi:hypothetical protein
VLRESSTTTSAATATKGIGSHGYPGIRRPASAQPWRSTKESCDRETKEDP